MRTTGARCLMGELMVAAVNEEGEAFGGVAKDDLDAGVPVEEAREYETHGVHCYLGAEPGTAGCEARVGAARVVCVVVHHLLACWGSAV